MKTITMVGVGGDVIMPIMYMAVYGIKRTNKTDLGSMDFVSG